MRSWHEQTYKYRAVHTHSQTTCTLAYTHTHTHTRLHTFTNHIHIHTHTHTHTCTHAHTTYIHVCSHTPNSHACTHPHYPAHAVNMLPSTFSSLVTWLLRGSLSTLMVLKAMTAKRSFGKGISKVLQGGDRRRGVRVKQKVKLCIRLRNPGMSADDIKDSSSLQVILNVFAD